MSVSAMKTRSTNATLNCRTRESTSICRLSPERPSRRSFRSDKRDVEFLNLALRDGTAETARVMGIPVVMSNKIARLVTRLPAGFPSQDVEFPGFSAVADSDGRLLSQLASGREGVAAGDVILDPARKARQRVAPIHGRWTTAMPWWAAAWRFTQWMGERSY